MFDVVSSRRPQDLIAVVALTTRSVTGGIGRFGLNLAVV